MTVEATQLTADDARRLTERIRVRLDLRDLLVDRIAADPCAVFPDTRRREPRQIGRHLYLMQAGVSGPVKIGRANKVESRREQLQPGSARHIEILYVINGAGHLERELHRTFAHLRLEGEWFMPDGAIFDWFRGARR